MNTFTLKMIALVLMVIDHIGYYFEGTPSWLRWLGRGSYPLFLFCMVCGYQYTRNRKRYLLRLYLMSLFMTFFSYTVDTVFVSQNGYGNHNIFLSMFLVGVLISTVELYQKDRKKGAVLLGAIAFVSCCISSCPILFPLHVIYPGIFLRGLFPILR